MIYQDVRKNTMQAYIKYEAYYDKKANASKLKGEDYVYILQPKGNHHGSIIPSSEFRWIGPYIIEKVLLNNNYLGRKIGTNKTQVLHRMRMRQFTTQQPPPDIRITPQEWKPVTEKGLEHDDLYARAWECAYQEPVFDAKNNNATPPSSPEVPVQSDLSTVETRITPRTAHESSQKNFPQAEELGDVTDTYPYMERDAETSSEQPNNSPTNPRTFKQNLRHNAKPNCNDV